MKPLHIENEKFLKLDGNLFIFSDPGLVGHFGTADYGWSADSYQGVLTPDDTLTNNRFPSSTGGPDMTNPNSTWRYQESFNGESGVQYYRSAGSDNTQVTISDTLTTGFTFFSCGSGYSTGIGARDSYICSFNGAKVYILHGSDYTGSYIRIYAIANFTMPAPEIDPGGNGKWAFAFRFDKINGIVTTWYHTELNGDFTDSAEAGSSPTSVGVLTVGGGDSPGIWVIGDTYLYLDSLSDVLVLEKLEVIKSKYGI